jgi:hypothetical protein
MTIKRTIIPESKFGVYVWEMPDGRVVANEQGDYFNIPAKFGDQKRIAQMRDAVKDFGITTGKVKFMSGRRRVSESEYEDQLERLLDNKVADPYDPGQFKEI